MALYKIKQEYKEGKRVTTHVKVTAKEAKAYVMKINNWTAREYEKKYDILRNKVRAYEAFERKHGVDNKAISVQELLYKQAKAKAREGTGYKPSLQMQRIQKFTSISSGKRGAKALYQGRSYEARRLAQYEKATQTAFEGFIKNNPTAQKINEMIKDPVLKEQALKDLAEKIHLKIDAQGKAQEGQTFLSSSQVFGSSDEVDDFDINDYL